MFIILVITHLLFSYPIYYKFIEHVSHIYYHNLCLSWCYAHSRCSVDVLREWLDELVILKGTPNGGGGEVGDWEYRVGGVFSQKHSSRCQEERIAQGELWALELWISRNWKASMLDALLVQVTIKSTQNSATVLGKQHKNLGSKIFSE